MEDSYLISKTLVFFPMQEAQSVQEAANEAAQTLEIQLAEIQSKNKQLKERLQEVDKDRIVSPTENVTILS